VHGDLAGQEAMQMWLVPIYAFLIWQSVCDTRHRREDREHWERLRQLDWREEEA
jgi:hypothetical protein